METRLALDSKAKQLNLAFKKKFVHSTDTELKVQGRLNTTNAAATVNTSLNKVGWFSAARGWGQYTQHIFDRPRLGPLVWGAVTLAFWSLTSWPSSPRSTFTWALPS